MKIEGKILGVSKVKQLHQIRLMLTLSTFVLNPAVPEIFYFKQRVGDSLIIILIENHDVSMQ